MGLTVMATLMMKYGVIPADDHVQEAPDVWTKRMSKAKFGDDIGSPCGLVEPHFQDPRVSPKGPHRTLRKRNFHCHWPSHR